MSRIPFDPVTVLVALIVEDVAPAVLSSLREDPRAGSNPGLAAASHTLDAWVRDLLGAPDATAVCADDRLAAALRGAFVAAASRGRVVVERHSGETVAELELDPGDIALVEAIRELAATLDERRGSAVADAFDVWRDDTCAVIFGLARHRAGERMSG